MEFWLVFRLKNERPYLIRGNFQDLATFENPSKSTFPNPRFSAAHFSGQTKDHLPRKIPLYLVSWLVCSFKVCDGIYLPVWNLVYHWSFVWKTLLDQRPKPHDSKIRQKPWISTESHRLSQKLQILIKNWISIKIHGFWSKTADFNQKPQIWG